MDIKELQMQAREIRKHTIKMVANAASGHPGGPMGLADIFSALYFSVLHHEPKNPAKEDRDRLILSNGHACAVRYAAMALSGYFPVEELQTFRKLGSRLQGHPSIKHLDGLESSSGSLGQGLSIAVGIALGAKLQGKDYSVYACISDGECGEGMTWEAAQSAVHYQLNNLIVFMDRNYIQIDGNTEDVMKLDPLNKKFESFGWNVVDADGHDFEQILQSFQKAKSFSEGPTMILFRTVLGKGVSFMENNPNWHGNPPNAEQAAQALQELDKAG